jgi:hypothetical protein
MPPQRQLPGARPPGPMPTSSGPLHAVVCPFCGQQNDLRTLKEQRLLDTGSGVVCDKCHMTAEITQILDVTFVSLRPSNKGMARPAAVPRQATTISTQRASALAGGVSGRPALPPGMRRRR